MFLSVLPSDQPTPQPPPPDPAQERTERQLRGLKRLAEIGLILAEELLPPPADPAAEAPPPPRAGAAERSLALTRYSKCVRMAMVLETLVAEKDAARVFLAQEEAAKAEAARIAVARGERIDRRRRQVDAAVCDAIDAADLPTQEAVDRLETDLVDWLDRADVDDLNTRTIGEMVAHICDEFGLPFDAALWEEPPDEPVPGVQYVIRRLAPPAPPAATLTEPSVRERLAADRAAPTRPP